MPVKKQKKTISFWWEHIASILTRKYSTKKSIKTYFSWQESLLLCNNQMHMGFFAPQHMEQKNGKERSGFGWAFVYFQLETWPHKNTKNQQSNVPSGPSKVWNLRKQKKAMLSTCYKWMEKNKKGICESNGFFKKYGVALTHHHGDFLNSGSSGYFLSAMCAHKLICHTHLHGLYCLSKISAIPNQKSNALLSGPPFIEWDPLFLSKALIQSVRAWLIKSVPFFELWCTIIHEKRHFLL